MLTNAIKELQTAKQQLAAKINSLAAEAKQIDQAIAALSGLSGSSPAPVTGKRKMSAAGREAIAAAAKKRWAKVKAAKTAAAKPAKKKRTMSAAAKQRLSEFQKARWAKINAAKAAAQ